MKITHNNNFANTFHVDISLIYFFFNLAAGFKCSIIYLFIAKQSPFPSLLLNLLIKDRLPAINTSNNQSFALKTDKLSIFTVILSQQRKPMLIE
jgi:hypothetical protein